MGWPDVSDDSVATPLASFEAKWAALHPEFGLALKFVPQQRRVEQSAFACLVYELEHTAFGIREAQPAAIKLQWWAEEFARAGRREARHPLTRALAEHPDFADVPLARWHAVIVGALAQRDTEPAADCSALLESYAVLYAPLAAIEAALFVPIDVAALTRVRSLARAIRETASLAEALRDGRLPLPLDVLAKYRMARGNLSQSSPEQAAMLRGWLLTLASDYGNSFNGARLGALNAAGASADRWRAGEAARAAEPLSKLQALTSRLPLRAVWAAWRSGRDAVIEDNAPRPH